MASKKNKKYHHMEKRGDVWYFIAMVKGKRHHDILSADEKEALSLRDDYLYEIKKYGRVSSNRCEVSAADAHGEMLFGEVVTQVWMPFQVAKKSKEQIKASTLRDYKSSMNCHLLPRFGNTPIQAITSADIDDFKLEMTCSPKRINNVLVPMRSVFKLAKKKGIVEENIMLDVDNLKVDSPDIYPFTIEEVRVVLDHVDRHYHPFFAIAFFTGMRFGEMAALKWKNVNLERGLIHIRETRVYGEEGRTKTQKSNRDIDILPPVKEALLQLQARKGKKKYVFRDISGSLFTPDHARKLVWTPALERADIDYRPMIQTRHSFATMMIDSGEDLGWVQGMLGHSSLQMIYTRYYSWIKKDTRNDGSAFLSKMYRPEFDASEQPDPPQRATGKIIEFTPNLHQAQKKGLRQKTVNPCNCW